MPFPRLLYSEHAKGDIGRSVQLRSNPNVFQGLKLEVSKSTPLLQLVRNMSKKKQKKEKKGGVFDQMEIETTDGVFPLIQLGQVAQKNPQLVVINMMASPQYISNVKHAIEKSGMNLNPQQDGTTLFIPLPKVTREHRENLAKSAKLMNNKTKDKLRDIQNNTLRNMKKAKDNFSSDLIHNIQETIQLTTHKYCEKADVLMQMKQEELLQGK